jgi:predicted nucleic acid-binding OB-fold protein
LIKKKEVKPINSHPSIKVKKLPDTSKVIILIAKKIIKEIKDDKY